MELIAKFSIIHCFGLHYYHSPTILHIFKLKYSHCNICQNIMVNVNFYFLEFEKKK